MIQDQNFGIEIEMTGITRNKAAKVLAKYFGTEVEYADGTHKKYKIKDGQGRYWQIMRDASITTEKKQNGEIVSANAEYSVEFVSPICTYRDIETIQELVRKLRQAGAIANESTGIHVHVDASRFDANSLQNLTNIMRSKEDILFKALQVEERREKRYCKKVDESFLQELNRQRPRTKADVQQMWYRGRDGSREHYHTSRYRALNLHSVFQKGTVEFRLYNGTMHAGKVKTYIQLSLAITNQALEQRRARYVRTVSTNEKYTFRTWLLRLGMIGDEFKTARMFLLEHLEGNIAWRDTTRIEPREEQTETQEINEETETDEIEDMEIGGMIL